jgi:hypothetical protein
MCESCESFARTVTDVAHRNRAHDPDWYEVIGQAASDGDVEALAGYAMAGAYVLGWVLDRYGPALRSAALAPWLDADVCAALMLDRAAMHLRTLAHADDYADGSQ